MGFPAGSEVKYWPAMQEAACNARDVGSIPGWEDPLKKEMAIHTSMLAWGHPWTEEAGRLQFIRSQELDMT